MINKSAWINAVVLLTMLNLMACSTRNMATHNPTSQGILAGATIGALSGAPVGMAVGGITGGLIANYTAKQKTLLQRLQQAHVIVIEVGEQVTLILPADQFFLLHSPALSPKAYPVLNDVAMLLRTYPKTSVVVTGYTDNLGSEQRNVALSKQRAQATADYLWSQEIDSRLLYTEGKGDAEALASNATIKGRQWNRRIEITFQRWPRE